MKKLFVPTIAILALIMGTGCDHSKEKVKKVTDATSSVMAPAVPASSEVNDQDEVITTDEVTSSDSSARGYGAATGAGAVGASAIHHKKTAVNKPQVYDSELEELDPEMDELDDSDFDRQAMEESMLYDMDEKTYKEDGFSEHQLDELKKRDNIFYGYPGASGASGSPGSAELVR